MSDSAIDFSVIDPQRDPDRWSRSVAATVTLALAQRRRGSFAFTLLECANSALLVAASITLVTWCGAAARQSSAQARNEKDAAAWVLTRWAVNDEVPSVASMLEVLGAQGQ